MASDGGSFGAQQAPSPAGKDAELQTLPRYIKFLGALKLSRYGVAQLTRAYSIPRERLEATFPSNPRTSSFLRRTPNDEGGALP